MRKWIAKVAWRELSGRIDDRIRTLLREEIERVVYRYIFRHYPGYITPGQNDIIVLPEDAPDEIGEHIVNSMEGKVAGVIFSDDIKIIRL